ncbi:MAG: PPC domain-containing DNA-binding protein [Candidatus Spechtbacterales bacterium]
MRLVEKHKNSYILRLDPGEEFISVIENFCAENNIFSGWVQAVGSTKALNLAFYELGEKKYKTSAFNEFLEILSVTGNIAKKEGKIFVHAHGVFGRSDMSVIGGHIKKCVISATGEIMIHAGKNEMHRELDEETGLHLLG